MKWRFYNKEIKLHTGYADFRYGAFVPRWKVQSFLTQLGKSGLGSDSIRHAEHYFGIWMNQYPWLLSNPPYMANGDKATEKNVAFDTSLDHYTYDAVRHLQRSLTADQSEAPQDYFERTEEPPVLSYRDVRSSCANDRCLFISNMDPFVSPQQVPFDYQNITSISKLEQAYNGLLSLPGSIEWEEHSFHRAADSDPNSCWNTIHAPRQKDYFGLILVGTANTKTVVIHTPQKIQNPERQLEVSVLQSDSEWTRCKITDQTIQNTDRITLDLHCPANVQFFRAIKVAFKKQQAEPFQICGLSIDTLSV
ncbi:hypothetical protein A0J61_09831 [Choanephora cucurbitarum]|uniref:Uncharacterized protein n=1 Tax=Choanephora cucurbitarum TaxID=101091 RepID=A0A1C7MZ33_9FUNG|nr:hypothetical protein A0J61_09831 [Choanephora cucurbitarum]